MRRTFQRPNLGLEVAFRILVLRSLTRSPVGNMLKLRLFTILLPQDGIKYSIYLFTTSKKNSNLQSMTVTHSSRMLPLGSYTFDLKKIIKVKFNGSLEGKNFGKEVNLQLRKSVKGQLHLIAEIFPADVLEGKDTKRIDAKTVSIRHIHLLIALQRANGSF